MQHSSPAWAALSRRWAKPHPDPGSPAAATADDPVVIKKYANRRLYDTAASRYITRDHLARMVKDGQAFKVVNARTGADITRNILMQIVVDAETRGTTHLLSSDFLRRLIRFYGDPLQAAVPAYLDASIATLAGNRDKAAPKADTAHTAAASDETPTAAHAEAPNAEAEQSAHDQLDALKRQLDLMQEEIDRLAVNKKG